MSSTRRSPADLPTVKANLKRLTLLLGVLQITVGCLVGFIPPSAVAWFRGIVMAHLEFTANGVLMVVFGFLVAELRLGKVGLWVWFALLQIGTWANGTAGVIAALAGASSPLMPTLNEKFPPPHGTDHPLVSASLQICGVTIVAALVMTIYGLGWRKWEQQPENSSMAMRTSKELPAFDFSEANGLPLSIRFARCLERARELVKANGYQQISNFPCVPQGASESELRDMESKIGRALPHEYRQFLTVCRYLKIDDGLEIGGLDYDGIYRAESPWVSSDHRAGVEYLVFANYWRYADGDQLMFDLSEPSHPVVAYLHEHGPLFEDYAPSFSLALWRLVHEE